MSEKVTKKYATLLRSQIELIKMFPREMQLDLLWMLIDYELDGVEPVMKPDKDGPSKLQIFWNMSRPLADARTQKSINGRKGGLQKAKNSKALAKSSKNVADSSKILADSSNTLADMDMEKDMDMEMEYPYLSGDIKNISPDRTDKERENKRESESIVEEIGDKIKELRKEKKLTQKELASAIGVTQGVIHFWETGRNKPSTYNLILLSRVLGRSLTNDLFKEKADLLDSFEQDMEKIKKETLEQHEDEDDDWDWDWDKIPDPKQIGSGEVNV